MNRRFATVLAAVLVASSFATIGGASTAGAVTKTTVVVQGGTTPVDSGLYEHVIFPMFTAKYPQYDLQYVSVGTAQAIANAQAGQGDVVFTHSPTAENTFVQQGYSYESGGRLVMASDFITVGPTDDPAGAIAAGDHNVVGAFQAIAAAGASGTAEFVSRGDGSGTNKNEQAIWKLTGIPVNTSGEPVNPTDTTQLAAWYHKTGAGQAQNIQVTNECPFTSGKCYALTDSGTYTNLVGEGTVPNLTIVSQFNDSPNAHGGVGLLLNPYHVYAVNPAKITNAHINLPGALAFLNFMTDPVTQAAIGKFPSVAHPAFNPDARPIVTVTQNVPTSVLTSATVTVAGTVKPNYYLDPPITNAPVFLERKGAPGVVIASGTLAADGSFSINFAPTITDTYTLFVPAYPDGLVTPTNTAYRQSVSVTLRKMTVTAVVRITSINRNGLYAGIHGTALPFKNRKATTVQLQYKSGTTWVNIQAPIAMPNSSSSAWAKTLHVSKAGTYVFRAHYTDLGIVVAAFSPGVSVHLP